MAIWIIGMVALGNLKKMTNPYETKPCDGFGREDVTQGHLPDTWGSLVVNHLNHDVANVQRHPLRRSSSPPSSGGERIHLGDDQESCGLMVKSYTSMIHYP